jgi:Ser/Thr protein kinase RdoA (MazF antagonist)
MEQPDNPQLARLELVARLALTRWGIEEAYTIELLKHRENAVYAVTRADGTKAAMRVHRLGYHSDAALRSELQWMEALRDGGVTTPEVIPTVDGDLLTRVRIDELSEEYQCDLLSWVEGVPLGSAEERSFSGDEAVRRTYLATGRLAARMHNQSAAWPLPAGFERHSWDEEGCLGPGALWGLYGDLEDLSPGELAHLDAGAAHSLRVLRIFGKASDRYGLIHSDFVPDNLLDTGTDIVVLDFDDCGFGWHLWEIATAVFWHLGGESYSVALGSFVEGYREYRALPDEHLALLPAFLLLRGLVYLGWIHTRRETETAGQIFPFVLEETTRLCDELLGE